MLSFLEAVVLGIIQGITEWIPVSSSAHLIFIQEIFQYPATLAYDVLLHMGTLIAVLLFYRKDLLAMLTDLMQGKFTSPSSKLFYFLLIATIFTGIIGIVFHDPLAAMFTSLTITAVTLILNGCFLFLCERWERTRSFTVKTAAAVGLAQGISIIPGISRSAATIGTALLLGIEKKQAARFSFLLSIPAIIGAFVLEFDASLFTGMQLMPVFVGVLTSAVVGYLTLKVLLRLVITQRFHLFAYYCWIVGIAVLIYTFF